MKSILSKFVICICILAVCCVFAGAIRNSFDIGGGISVYAADDAESDDDSSEESDGNTPFQIFFMLFITLGCLAIVLEWIISSIIKAHKERKNMFSKE